MSPATRIRLVHTADLHLGTENYGRWNARTGLHARLEDYLRSFDQVIDHSLAVEADVLLVAGDIFKSKDPTPTQQREFARRVRRVTAAGLQVVLLVGNHDQPNRHGDANPLDIYSELAFAGVTIFRRPGLVTLQTRSGPLQVAGLPHLPRSYLLAREAHVPRSMAAAERLIESALDAILAALAAEVDPAIPAVLTAHLSIDRASLGSEAALMLGKGLTLPLGALALPCFDYVAMGHIHQPQVLGADPPCVYPGSLDRIDFGEASDDKGFMVVDLRKGEAPVMTRVPVEVRAFVTVSVDLTDEPDPTTALVAAIARQPIAQAVVRVSYAIQAERAHEVDEARVREALATAFDVAWRPELQRGAARGRHPGLGEALSNDPLLALERYVALRPELAPWGHRLREKARGLLAEAESGEVGA